MRYVAIRSFALVLTLLAVIVTESACSSTRPLLAVFFDGLPPAGVEEPSREVVRKPRREAWVKPVERVLTVDVPEPPPAIDWRARYDALPRSEGGAVAWTKALDEKAIRPAPGLAPDAKDDDPTDMDVEIATSGQADFKAIFAHKVHTQWMPCTACHTGIFAMEKGKTKMTMAAMGEGQQCGVCHGKVAAPELSGCPACHSAAGK